MASYEKKKDSEIVKQQKTEGVSVIKGGIRIDASWKPTETKFEVNWGKVYMVLDCSASMTGYKLEQAKAGILDFAKDALRKEYLTGLIKFDSSATHLCEPVKDIRLIESFLNGIVATGSTNMVDAIKLARIKLKNVDCSRVIVIATDGQPDNAEMAIKAGILAKGDGIEIITIGTDDADQQFLKKLASRTELGTKVSKEMFAKAISSAYKLLPSAKGIVSKDNK